MSDLPYPIHYRYQEGVYQEGIEVLEKLFFPIRETECYYFVLDEFNYKLHQLGQDRTKFLRKVGKRAARSYCYPSQKEAMESFIIRKKKQAWHAKNTLNLLEVLFESESLLEPENVKVMHGVYRSISIPAKKFVEENYVFD